MSAFPTGGSFSEHLLNLGIDANTVEHDMGSDDELAIQVACISGAWPSGNVGGITRLNLELTHDGVRWDANKTTLVLNQPGHYTEINCKGAKRARLRVQAPDAGYAFISFFGRKVVT